jgi:hypothetical protein
MSLSGLRLPPGVQELLLNPRDGFCTIAKSSARPDQRGRGNIQYCDVIKPGVEQIIYQSRRAASDIY